MQGLRGWQVVVSLVALLLTGCGIFTCESPIERERRELREAGETSEAVLYRGLKVTLRSAPLEAGIATDPSATKIRQLTARIFARLLAKGSEGRPDTEPTAADYVALAKEFYDLRAELRVANEDDYPTLLQQIVTASGNDPATVEALRWYDSSWEHLVLALLWTSSSSVAPQGFVIYEIGQLDPAGIQDHGVRMGARLIRAGAFYRYRWVHLTEEETTAYLADLEDHSTEVIAFTRTFGGPEVSANDDVVHAQWHAPGVLLRGVARMEIEDQDEASLDDLDAFLTDAQTLGLDDEGVWLIGAYVGIRREDGERALTNLRKLEGSPLLDDDARTLVRDTIAALEDRDPDSALNRVTDKILMAKIVGSYLLRVLAKVRWREELQATESGRALLKLDAEVRAEVDRLEGALSTEQLEELTASTVESARALGRSTKDKAAEAWHRAVGD
ncbi:hypothetical protein [Paraliomyxa miuraensis]|uniref:hypothetical protein n=1 Tax=Paraliomyxa miuraensis TaxID=376150 RepID=UPI00224FD53E|nr:hypothetical protein [Paraliomyxa miuraensis]MCX4246063.1 hypothetical protein [Paraliomyxa miuraensis]